MSEEAALRAITLEPARILRIADRVGSLEKGKDADVLILDRHPLDVRAFVETAIIEGKVYYERAKSPLYRDIPGGRGREDPIRRRVLRDRLARKHPHPDAVEDRSRVEGADAQEPPVLDRPFGGGGQGRPGPDHEVNSLSFSRTVPGVVPGQQDLDHDACWRPFSTGTALTWYR